MNQRTPDQAFRTAINLQQHGHADQACAIYQQLLPLFPDNSRLLHMYGVAELMQKHYDAGFQILQRALQRAPDAPEILMSLGNGLLVRDCPDQALPYLEKAVAIRPDFADAHFNRAIALSKLGRTEAAISGYRRVTECDPGHAQAWFLLGNLLCQRRQFSEAIACYDKAIARAPNMPGIYAHRGNAFAALGRADDALADYRMAITRSPQNPEAHFSYAHTLHELGRLEEALAEYDAVLALMPGDGRTLTCRGIAMADIKRPEAALKDFDAALALNPKDANTLISKGRLLLRMGRYHEGWPLYENRWRGMHLEKYQRHYPQPRWYGDQPRWHGGQPGGNGKTSLTGKRLFIWPEQGLGDFIQCVRFAAMASERGARVILETPPPLADLMRTSLPGEITQIPADTGPPDFDLHIPVMSLPGAFDADEAMLREGGPYLFADPGRVEKWHARLGEKTRPRIGIVCSGNPAHNNDLNRSIAAERLQPLFDLPFDFHLLQPDIRAKDAGYVRSVPNLYLHTDKIRDYADTAALMGEMDQIITVDTSAAHLAGALGLAVWLLLPFCPDGRWMEERGDTPWYPAARLFRQKVRGDWEEVLQRVRNALQEKFNT